MSVTLVHLLLITFI